MQDVNEQKFETWAVVELMGHATFAGLISEQQIAGEGFIRLDVPALNGSQAFTKYLSPKAVYAITPCDEQSARLMALRLSAPAIPANVARLAAPDNSGW